MKRPLLFAAASIAVLLLALLLVVTGERHEVPYTIEFPVMGTVAKLAFYDVSEETAQQAAAAVRSAYAQVTRLADLRDPGSELSRLNATAAERPFVCSAGLWNIISEAKFAYVFSGGAFDITAKPLMDLWGFYRRNRRGEIPTAAEIAEARRVVGFDKLILDEKARSVRFSVPGMAIDLGGIAKGYALDRASEVVGELGVTSGVIDLGGNLRLLAEPPPGQESYRVGVRRPDAPGELSDVALELRDAAVSTSGNYMRFVEIGGRRYGHIMDPATGMPTSRTGSVTVVTGVAVIGDWLSTTLFLRPELAARAEAELGALIKPSHDLNGAIDMNNTSRFFSVPALLLLFMVLYLVPLAARPMLRPDEFRYAEIPREMISSGNWISPRLAGMRYFEKPALGYQLTALSFKCFGENGFALRLPSALATAVAAAALWFLLRRKTEDPLLPGLATAFYLLFGIVYGIGTFGVLDSMLTAALTVVLVAFYFACEARSRLETVGFLILAGVAAGVAFLLKGFLAFVVPGMIAAAYLVWQRELKKLLLYPWIPLLAAVAVALPWSLAILREDPDFWRYFVVEEHWMRLTSGTYDRKPEPFWYYLPVLIGGIMPVGLFLAAGWAGVTRGGYRRPLMKYLLLWAWLPFGFFSISACKLGTYILPCFAPLAVFFAVWVIEAMRSAHSAAALKGLHIVYRVIGAALLAASAGWLVMWALGFCCVIPISAPPWGFVALLTGGVLALVADKARDWQTGAAWFLTALVLTVAGGIWFVPVEFYGEARATGQRLSECAAVIPLKPGDELWCDRNTMQAAAWTFHRTDGVVLGRKGEFEYALKNFPEEYAGRHVAEDHAPGRKVSGVLFVIRRLERKPLPEWIKVIDKVQSGGVTALRFEVKP
ncbi:MAG: FAD:protein FMN transferase [Victivallaceae bacterium]|nr:FAD:protein FMN transferase [Victivallaceae bacterium]